MRRWWEKRVPELRQPPWGAALGSPCQGGWGFPLGFSVVKPPPLHLGCLPSGDGVGSRLRGAAVPWRGSCLTHKPPPREGLPAGEEGGEASSLRPPLRAAEEPVGAAVLR